MQVSENYLLTGTYLFEINSLRSSSYVLAGSRSENISKTT